MKDNFFIDSNVALFLFDKDSKKSDITYGLIGKHPVISVQVINESINVLLKKFKLTKETAFEHGMYLLSNCSVMHITTDTVKAAMKISLKYGFSYWDSLIVASALENNCNILYSEDMQHNQIIENKLTIINPFLNL